MAEESDHFTRILPEIILSFIREANVVSLIRTKPNQIRLVAKFEKKGDAVFVPFKEKRLTFFCLCVLSPGNFNDTSPVFYPGLMYS